MMFYCLMLLIAALQGTAFCSQESVCVSNCRLDEGREVPTYTFILKFILPKGVMMNAPLCPVLYKGQMLHGSDMMFLFQESRCSLIFSVIITPDITYACTSAHKSLVHLVRKAELPIRWYDLTLHFSQGVWKWEITELPVEKMPLLFPKHALVVCLDPACIEGLGNPTRVTYGTGLYGDTGSCTLEMPCIKLKGDRAAIEQYFCASQCCVLHLRETHTALRYITHKSDASVICTRCIG